MKARRARSELLAFGSLLALFLLPIWAFSYFPSQDGPIHLANARTWLDYDEPDHAVYRFYYITVDEPNPNWLSQWLLAGFMLGFSPATAEKILVSLLVLGLPLALHLALETLRRGSGYLALLVLPFVLVPLAIGLGRQRDRLARDLGLARGRRARARARKRFRTLRRRLEQPDSAEFHEELAHILVDFVADRFNRSAAGMTYELADELLGSKGVGSDLRRRFRSCLETCDFARFVPASGEAERREEILAQATKLIEELERAW